MKSRSPGVSWIDPSFRPRAATIAAAQFFGKTVEAWLTPSYASPARGLVRYESTRANIADVDAYAGTIDGAR